MKDCLLVNFIGRKGAGSAIAYEMTKALINNGQCVVAVLSADIENRDLWEKLMLEKLIFIEAYHSKVDFIPKTISFILFESLKIKKSLKKLNVKTIYCPMIQPWTIFVNRLFKKSQKIVTLHDPEPHSGGIKVFDYLCEICTKGADDVIILSEKFKEFTSRTYNIPLKNVHVIPHGDFKYYKDIQKEEIIVEYDKEQINFLFFGRFTKYKGLNILAEAFERVSEEINCTLTIAGSGDFGLYENMYSDLTKVTVLNRWFKDEEVGNLFTGENIILVLPYTDATQSGVIPIAIEYGIPVIASNTGGLSEQIVSDVTGILVQTGQMTVLSEAMITLAKDKNKQNTLVTEAYKRNLMNSWSDISIKLISICS